MISIIPHLVVDRGLVRGPTVAEHVDGDEPEMIGMQYEVSGVRLGVAADAVQRRTSGLDGSPDSMQRVQYHGVDVVLETAIRWARSKSLQVWLVVRRTAACRWAWMVRDCLSRGKRETRKVRNSEACRAQLLLGIPGVGIPSLSRQATTPSGQRAAPRPLRSRGRAATRSTGPALGASGHDDPSERQIEAANRVLPSRAGEAGARR